MLTQELILTIQYLFSIVSIVYLGKLFFQKDLYGEDFTNYLESNKFNS